MTDFNTTDREVERAIRSWLHEDRHEDASRLAGAVLDQLDTTPQRRATWWRAWRTPSMNRFAAIGLGTVSVAVLLFVGARLLGTPSGGVGDPSEPAATREASVASAEWRRVADAPEELTEVAVAAHDGRIWVAGGFDAAEEPVDMVWLYDPQADEWSSGPPLPTPVHHAALVSTGEDLLLIGGYIGSEFGSMTNAVWRLTDDGTGWDEDVPLPRPTAAGAAAWDGSRVVYGGGVTPGGATTDIFARVDGEWSRIAALWRPREHLAAASDGEGRTWFLGGRVGPLTTNLRSVFLVEGDSATNLGELLTPRGGVSGFYAPGIGACSVGGEEPEGTFDTVECVNADGDVTTLPPLTVARHGTGAAVLDGVAYAVVGGTQPAGSGSAVVEALDLP